MARLSVDDWQALRADYRLGIFSNCQLAQKYGVTEAAIRKRAVKEDWGKDLTEQIQKEINRRLQKFEPQNAKFEPRTLDSDIVEAAAASGAAVVQRHRRILDKAQAIIDDLLPQIADAPVDRQIPMVKELSVAAKNLIELERRAWNLDVIQETAPLEDRLKAIINAKH